jgi:hypothetical protein
MSFDLDTYLDSLPTSLCSYSIKLQYSGEAANTNFIVFDILYKTLNPIGDEIASMLTSNMVDLEFEPKSGLI